MIKKLKISLLIAVFSLGLLGGVSYANAANLTFNSDTYVSIGGTQYIITSGSEATQIVVTATTLAATVLAGDSFTLASPAGFELGDNQAIVEVCTGGQSSSTYTPDPGATVTYTPTTIKICSGTSPGGSGGSADTTPPTSTSVSISAGATTTTSTSIALTLAATGASHMMISNTSAFTGASWETYATSKAWTLATGDGVKTVYAKFKDTAGNISTAVSDTITLGAVAVTTLPTGCLTGDLFSATTGLSCAVTTAVTALPAGCAVGDLFSATTGLTCGVATAAVIVPGCTTGDLYSATSGVSCGTTTSAGTTTTTTTAGTTTATTGAPAVASANLTAVKAITSNLYYGMTGKADVKTLQQFLIDQNKGPKAEALGAHGTTTNFFSMTKAALAEWQSAMDISPAVGYFGSITRGVIDNL